MNFNDFTNILIILGLFILFIKVISINNRIERFNVKAIEKASNFEKVGLDIGHNLNKIYKDEEARLLKNVLTTNKIKTELLPPLENMFKKDIVPLLKKNFKKETKSILCNDYDKVCKAIIEPVYQSADRTCNATVSELEKDVCGEINKLIDPEISRVMSLKRTYDGNHGIQKLKRGGHFIPDVARDAARKVDTLFNKSINTLNKAKNICPGKFAKLNPCDKTTKQFENTILNKCYKEKVRVGCK